MVFSSVKIVSAAKLSAELWQYMACFREHERIEGQQLLDLVICFPLQQLGRLILCVWTFLCVPPQPYYSSSFYDDEDDDNDDDGSSSYSGNYNRYFYYQQVPDDDDDDDSNSD